LAVDGKAIHMANRKKALGTRARIGGVAVG